MFNILDRQLAQAAGQQAGQSSDIKPSASKTEIPKIGRIEVKRDLCIGAQTCVALAPDVFEMDAENKAVVKNAKGNDDETILMAARSCPVLAIFIYDEKGNQIFP